MRKRVWLWWLLLVPVVGVGRLVLAPPSAAEPQGSLPQELESLSGPQRLMRLKEQLDSPLPATRVAAAELLAEPQADRWSMIVLTGAALRDNDSEVRRKAAVALAKRPLFEVAAPLGALLHDDDLRIRQEVAHALALLAAREPEHVKPLIPALRAAAKDPDPTVRAQVAEALGHFKQKDLASLNTASNRTVETRPQRQDPAPELLLTDLDGRTHSPARSGKLTVLHFWGSWCAPCRPELPRLQALSQQAGVEVLGVALEEESPEALRRFCQKHGLTYPQVLATKALTDAYGEIHKLPVTILVDAKGKIRYRWQGERPDNSVARAVARFQGEASRGDTITPDGRHNLR